jgi:hypothetical protein
VGDPRLGAPLQVIDANRDAGWGLAAGGSLEKIDARLGNAHRGHVAFELSEHAEQVADQFRLRSVRWGEFLSQLDHDTGALEFLKQRDEVVQSARKPVQRGDADATPPDRTSARRRASAGRLSEPPDSPSSSNFWPSRRISSLLPRSAKVWQLANCASHGEKSAR